MRRNQLSKKAKEGLLSNCVSTIIESSIHMIAHMLKNEEVAIVECSTFDDEEVDSTLEHQQLPFRSRLFQSLEVRRVQSPNHIMMS